MAAKQKGFVNAAQFSVPTDLISALPEISDLIELKLLLYFFSKPDRPTDPSNALTWTALVRDHSWSRNFSAEQLSAALRSAVEHGFLIEETRGSEKAYILNMASGATTAGTGQDPAEAGIGGLFSLYEQNIGPITPIIADAVVHANEEYPPAWIEEAIAIAVKMNKRSWKYIEVILKRWKEEGHATIQDRRDPDEDSAAGRRRKLIEDIFD